MFNSKLIVLVLLAAIGAAVANPAGAQQPTYYYLYPQSPGASLHYHRIYQGNYWSWSPAAGWYPYQSYVDVPHWTPAPLYAQPYWVARW